MTLVQNNGYFPLVLKISCPQTTVKQCFIIILYESRMADLLLVYTITKKPSSII